MALHQTMIGRTSQAGYIAACHAIRDADLTSFATDIEPPVLCIGGQHDKSVPAEMVQALADMIPNGRAEIFDDLGHIPSLEMPRELAALIETIPPGRRRSIALTDLESASMWAVKAAACGDS